MLRPGMKELMHNSHDALQRMWDDQRAFMKLLIEHRGFPEHPLDLSKKENQRFVKSILQDAAGELYEAINELKNSKKHRATEIEHFDRSAFLEEIVDSHKFLNEVLILAGFSLDEYVTAYFEKSNVNVQRIIEGY